MTDIVCEDEEKEKTSETLEKILEVFKQKKLRTQDIILVLGNLSYSIGAALEGHEPGFTGPTIDELNQKYYTEPTVGVALMLQGLITVSWHDQIVNGQAPNIDKENNNG